MRKNFLNRCKNGLILLITPLLLLPLLFYYNTSESKCAFVVILMIIYWIFQPIPLTITALIPIALFPLFGLQTTEKSCEPYLKSTNILFMSSLILAISIEHCNLHKRLAYRILLSIGIDNIPKLFGSFMFITSFLGIWIINTATTAMILPIADVVVNEIFNFSSSSYIDQNYQDDNVDNNNNNNNNNNNIELNNKNHHINYDKKTLNELNYIKRLLYICIAFSATIGGTTTLTSNGPNLVFQFVLDEFYGNVPDVDYTKWLIFCLPATVLTILSFWLYIKLAYLNQNILIKIKKFNNNYGDNNRSINIINEKYQELGIITYHEIFICIIFLILILLWMFRDPQFMQGWSRLLGHNIIPKDATPAILIIILLFCIPKNPWGPYPSESLLEWNFTQQKLAWGVILLRGGGFAMADTAFSSGLTKLISEQLIKINSLPYWLIIIIMSLLASFTTELASNSAIASILLPISGQIAHLLGKNPLYFLIPITLSCSYAFLLPVGTPANALVATHSKLKPFDTVIPGFFTKIICLTIMFLNLFIIGVPMFSLDTKPSWLNGTSNIL